MNKLELLISNREILKLSGEDQNIATCSFNGKVKLLWKEFKDCLGVAFMDHLLSHLADYSEKIDWVAQPYTEGSVVKYKGCYVIALKDTGREPNTEDWGLAPKFTSECLNDLWCEGCLGEYLAHVLIRKAGIKSTIVLTNSGLVKKYDSGTTAGDRSDINLWLSTKDKDIKLALEFMDEYMAANNEAGCFDLYKGIAKKCCGSCGCVPVKCECENSCKTKNTWNRWGVG